jgi:hypothetical protein
MDDERLKNPDGRPDYFDEMLERIRDIRASEKRFHQKVRDLFVVPCSCSPKSHHTLSGRASQCIRRDERVSVESEGGMWTRACPSLTLRVLK